MLIKVPFPIAVSWEFESSFGCGYNHFCCFFSLNNFWFQFNTYRRYVARREFTDLGYQSKSYVLLKKFSTNLPNTIMLYFRHHFRQAEVC